MLSTRDLLSQRPITGTVSPETLERHNAVVTISLNNIASSKQALRANPSA